MHNCACLFVASLVYEETRWNEQTKEEKKDVYSLPVLSVEKQDEMSKRQERKKDVYLLLVVSVNSYLVPVFTSVIVQWGICTSILSSCSLHLHLNCKFISFSFSILGQNSLAQGPGPNLGVNPHWHLSMFSASPLFTPNSRYNESQWTETFYFL